MNRASLGAADGSFPSPGKSLLSLYDKTVPQVGRRVSMVAHRPHLLREFRADFANALLGQALALQICFGPPSLNGPSVDRPDDDSCASARAAVSLDLETRGHG